VRLIALCFTHCQASKNVATAELLANCLYFGDKNALRLPIYSNLVRNISSLQWYILYCNSENNGTISWQIGWMWSTYHISVTFTNVIYIGALSRIYKSRPPNPTSVAPRDPSGSLSTISFRAIHLRRIHPHLRSSLAFTFFFLLARMFVSRARNRSDRTRFYSSEGLRTSALEDFIEGFPKSRRRFWAGRHRPRRRRGNEEARGIRGRRPEGTRKANLSCLSEGKRYLLADGSSKKTVRK